MRARKILRPVVLAAIAAASTLAVTGCGSVTVNRDPVGEPFPSVTGTALSGDGHRLPADLAGEPALLLIGYVQDAQFDLDRWLLGLRQAEVEVRTLELPTIDGMLPGLFAGTIDDGMRSGIPREDWPSVVTVYGDADRIVAFTGDEKPRNGRVVLLDGDGVVRWFHDRGYSAAKVLELRDAVRGLANRRGRGAGAPEDPLQQRR